MPEAIDRLLSSFGTQVFNIHPAASEYPFGAVPADLADKFFVESVDVAIVGADLAGVGGMCPDYAQMIGCYVFGQASVRRFGAVGRVVSYADRDCFEIYSNPEAQRSQTVDGL